MEIEDNYPIEYFKMDGVYGYKNLSMWMKDKTTIFVSENGTGKTTILNALNAVLTFDLMSLRKMNFQSVSIKLRGSSDEVVITKPELQGDIYNEIEEYIISEVEIYPDFWEKYRVDDIVTAINNHSDSISIREDSVMHHLYLNSPYDYDSIDSIVLKIKSKIKDNLSVSYASKLSILKEQLDGFEIVYLPTYRRIEKSFESGKSNIRKRDAIRRGRKQKISHNGIAYGLRDVEETLSDITIEIERQSSMGYRALSAKMLDDLIRRGDDNFSGDGNELPAIEDLERFLSRIEKPQHVAPDLNKRSSNYGLIEELKNLYIDNKIKENKYLNYFLSKLNSVVQETKEQEFKIENFVTICNKYLKSAGDSKLLMFDPTNLEVIVNDEFSGEGIDLNDLSSGEKQVISLMAKLYLGNVNKKILLIDEPELSLSLKWQRLILPDVNNAKNVSQVIAITHSPFIYDNDLETCATSLDVRKVMPNA